jgi:hypothetical protein
MGSWGTGLYSGDFAMDLRSTIAAVVHLPFDGDRLVEILSDSAAAAANNPNNEDHATFWLIVADQFVKRGIISNRAREKALEIIDSGSDLATLSKLGMNPRDLSKRQRMLADLRTRLTTNPEAAKLRPVLKKPQAFVMEVGEVFVYPTSGGDCINSYYASKDKIPGWKQDGWGAVVIVQRGRAFDFLVWYRPLTISYARGYKPSLAQLRAEPLWVLQRPGTCSRVHFKRLELEKVGAVAIDADKLARIFPDMGSGKNAAVNDISLANALSVGPNVPAALMPTPGQPLNFSRGRPYPTIASLDEILSG